MAWPQHHDDLIRKAYAAFPPPACPPISDLADLVGRTPAAVRSRAHALGLSNGTRRGQARRVAEIPCPNCGSSFVPNIRTAGVRIASCSPACAAALRSKVGYEHPRGMAGKSHSPEAKKKIGEASRRYWATMPPDEMEQRRERARSLGYANGQRGPTSARHTRSRGGKREDLDNRYFRSAWEANYARWLNYLVSVGVVERWEYEPRTFEFKAIQKGTRFYTPDFLVVFPDGHHEWHEVKGWMHPKGATAIRRFQKYYPDETLVLIDEPVYRGIAVDARSVIPTWE